MALGITYTAIPIKNAGGFRFRVAEFTYDATYAANGYAVTAAALGLKAITFVSDGVASGAANTGFAVDWDHANSKLKVYKPGADGDPMDEAATNQASLTGLTSRHLVIGY